MATTLPRQPCSKLKAKKLVSILRGSYNLFLIADSPIFSLIYLSANAEVDKRKNIYLYFYFLWNRVVLSPGKDISDIFPQRNLILDDTCSRRGADPVSEAKKILFQLLERGSSITHLCVEKRAALLRSRELLACLHSYFFTRLTKRKRNPYLHEGRDLKVVFICMDKVFL